MVGQRVASAKVERSRELRREMTEAEKALWQALRAHRAEGLRFRRQQVIDGFIVDFYCHAADLVVEVDGSVHADPADYDRERDELLATRGLRVLRVANEDVQHDLPAVLRRILSAARGE